MPELSLQNIDQICSDMKKQEITFSHLLDELTDHVCCDVEHEMQNGMTFHEAYRLVRQKIGKRGIKEIQEETLYAVDTKYRKMKNTMKISGIAGTILLGFAALLKIMHWPGAGILLVTGTVTLAFIFIPSALGVLWKETHSTKRLFLYISAFLAGMLFIMGTLFKIQHWPYSGSILTLAALIAILFFIPALTVNRFSDPENKSKRGIYLLGSIGLILFIAGMLFKIQHWPLASTSLMLGMFILFIIVFPWYTRKTWKEENSVNAMFIFLVVGSMSLIVPSAIINLSLQRNFVDGYYTHQGQEQKLYSLLYTSNEAFLTQRKDSKAFASMNQLHAKTTDLIKVIDGIEKKMIVEAESRTGDPLLESGQIRQTEMGQMIEFGMIKNPFDQQAVSNYLFTATASRAELESTIEGYKNYVSGFDSIPELKEHLLLLNAETYLPSDDQGKNWISMMNGLHSLALLKNGILSFESFALAGLANR
jgi:hypothetical protein